MSQQTVPGSAPKRPPLSIVAISVALLGGCCGAIKEGPHRLVLAAEHAGEHRIGQFFNVEALTIEVEELPGSVGATGFATAGAGSKRIVRTVDASVHFGLPYPLRRATLVVESSGRLTVQVNGVTQSVLDPTQLRSQTHPLPIEITVTADDTRHRIEIAGSIRDLRVGGHDLLIDEFVYTIDGSGRNLALTGGTS